MLYSFQGIFLMSFWFVPQPVKQVKFKEEEMGLEMLTDVVQRTPDVQQMPTRLSVFTDSPVSPHTYTSQLRKL